MKRTNIPSYLAHKLGILVALGVLVMIAVMASQRAPTVTHAAPQPTVSLDVLQKGKPINGCPVVKEDKCTLNATDAFDVQIKINDFAGLTNGNYGDWDAHLTFSGVTFKTTSFTASACDGLGAKTHSTSGTGVDDVTCSNSNGLSNSALLATANFNCVAGATGTVTLTQVNIHDDARTITLGDTSVSPPVLVDRVTINCGETAKLGLEMKSTIGDPVGMLVNDTFDVGIKLSDLKVKDANGNGTAGYRAWQTRVNFGAGLQLQSTPVTFLLPPNPITALNLATGTALLGATVNTGAPETSAVGNLANLRFKCISPGVWTITLKSSTSETFLVSEKKGQPTLTLDPAIINIDCRAAVMSLRVKAGSKTSQGNTFWVYQGNKFTVSVDVDQLRKLTYDQVRAQITYDGTHVGYQSADFLNPPCPTAGTASASATHIDVSCGTTTKTSNSTFSGGNVFDLVFECLADNADEINSITFTLVDGTGTPTGLLDKSNVWRNAFFSTASVTIHCVGQGSDKDKDGCTVAQEAALNLSRPALHMDSNVPDYWDTNRDDRIDILDVLAYVKAFGQKPSGTVLNTNGGNPPRIDIDDILNVIKLYGTRC